jgi:hypothetical protein
MSTSEDQPSMIELIELSDLAWTIIDPRRARVDRAVRPAAVRADWAPAEGVAALRDRLSDVTDAVRADGDVALLRVLSAVIVYLASHPERRRVEQAVVGRRWTRNTGGAAGRDRGVAARQPSPPAQTQRHGARQPRWHFHARPVEREDDLSAPERHAG